MGFLFVGLGGALGAMLRYALSLITVKTEFPLMTFLTNILGAFAIGLIVGIASEKKADAPNLILFLETGFLRRIYHVFHLFTGNADVV